MDDKSATAGPQQALPLAGIRVIELGQNIAGPFAGVILASLGAEVIKVERPDGGDDARGWGPAFVDGLSTAFHSLNYNKASVTLDLKDRQAVAELERLLVDADVLLQNMRPGAMEQMGLDSQTLLQRYPKLVYCAISAYGARGPMRGNAGYEAMIQAFSGMWSVNGDETGPPTRVATPILDYGTGVWTALGCIAALLRRATSGRGGLVDTSLMETSLGWLSGQFSTFSRNGRQPPRHRSGSPILVVFDTFQTADGEVVVGAASDRLLAKLVTELGHAEWASDERFAVNANRLKHKKELIALLEPIFRTASTQAWLDRLEAIGIPCAPIHDFRQARDAAQTQALGIFQPVPGIDHELVTLPMSFDGQRPGIRSAAPALGAHNQTYLRTTGS